MSLLGDQVAVVLLPPGVKADQVEVIISEHEGPNNAWIEARKMADKAARKIAQIVEKKKGPQYLTHAIVIETE